MGPSYAAGRMTREDSWPSGWLIRLIELISTPSFPMCNDLAVSRRRPRREGPAAGSCTLATALLRVSRKICILPKHQCQLSNQAEQLCCCMTCHSTNPTNPEGMPSPGDRSISVAPPCRTAVNGRMTAVVKAPTQLPAVPWLSPYVRAGVVAKSRVEARVRQRSICGTLIGRRSACKWASPGPAMYPVYLVYLVYLDGLSRVRVPGRDEADTFQPPHYMYFEGGPSITAAWMYSCTTLLGAAWLRLAARLMQHS
jgi:hypothetical protein